MSWHHTPPAIDVPEGLYKQLRAWAQIEGVSVDHIAEVVLREYLDRHTLPLPSVWRRMQMRGGGGLGRPFAAHADDVARYDALPWYRRLRSLESWLRSQYGDAIYGGRYAR